MKRLFYKAFFLFFIPLFAEIEVPTGAAVTYEFSGGRLGDNLLAYMHAKWLSYKYDLPLLYRSFAAAEQFYFDEIETPFTDELAKRFEHELTLGVNNLALFDPASPTLYRLPYYPEDNVYRENPRLEKIIVDWKDPQFKQLLQNIIRPKTAITWKPPAKKISVAVHVRRGGGFDSRDAWKKDPLKFPPNNYYIEQLERAYRYFRYRPLYVYIFTDDPDPASIVKDFQKKLPLVPIEYDYRRKNKDFEKNQIEDFFMMAQCSCIIRPVSNFSLIAVKISNQCALEFYPTSYHFSGYKAIIDKYEMVIHKK
jgi:hypothetical protein